MQFLRTGRDAATGEIIGDVIRRVPNLAPVEPDVTDEARLAQLAQRRRRNLEPPARFLDRQEVVAHGNSQSLARTWPGWG